MRKSILAAIVISLAFAPAAHAEINWKQVEQAFGFTGVALPGDVYRFGFPRSDLSVTLDGIRIKPALALGSWVAFRAHGDQAMAMGDLVLTEHEVNPVMKRLIEGGFEITALHNHILRATPMVMYMHVSAHGDPVKLAETLHAALALSKTPLQMVSAAPPSPTIDLDAAAIGKILGAQGRPSGGVLQFTVPRKEAITDAGMDVPPALGSAIAINFQPTGGGKAAITGDFVLLEGEVNPVLRALRENGIEVTALHSHMLTETPRLFFMHFWANDDALKLAAGLRAALDKTNSVRQ